MEKSLDKLPDEHVDKIYLLLSAIIIHLILVLYAAGGVRGSDQYWYVADVTSLMKGNATTNCIYPVNILKHDPVPPHFIHNILNLYLVVPFAALTRDAYSGWILANILATLSVALVIRALLRRFGYSRVADLVAAIWLLLPMSVWLTSQASSEATGTAVVAIAVYATITATRTIGWIAAILLWVAATYCRFTFAPALLAVSALYFVTNRSWLHASLLLLLAVIFLALQAGLFPTGGPNLIEVVRAHSRIQGLMGPYMLWVIPSLDWSGLIANGGREIAKLFVPQEKSWFLFYLPVLVVGIGAVVATRHHKHSDPRLLALTLVLTAITLATLVLHTNQPRFLQALLPTLLIFCAPIILAQSDRKRWMGLLFLLLLASASVAIAYQARASSMKEAGEWGKVGGTLTNIIPPQDGLMYGVTDGAGHGQALSYYCRPRLVG